VNGAIIGLYYKPLLLTTYSILYSLFGANSFFYHFFQLILHISNTILIYILFTRFFKKELAFILSLLFLIHPLNADTVDYVANLQDVMFTFFGLLAMYIVIFKKQKPLTLFLAGLSFFLSLLSKETGVAFCVMIISYCFLFEKNKLKNYSIIMISLVIFYGIIHLAVIGSGFSTNQPFPIMRESLAVRLLSIPAIIVYYVTTFFYPMWLSLDHQWVIKTVTVKQFYLPLFMVVILLCLLYFFFYHIRKSIERVHLLTFFSIWFLIGLLLHLQIIPLDYTVANRWFYFPIIGLLGIFGVMIMQIHSKIYIRLLLTFCVLLIILLSVRTIIRNSNWYNGITLATHDLQYSPEDYSLESYLGVQYYNLGQYDKARNHFIRSTGLAPYWDLNWNYLGEVYEREGDAQNNKQLINKAKQMYFIAIKNSVNDEIPYDNMAHLLVFSADLSTESFIKDSLKKYPHGSELWYYLAIYELSKHNKQAALEDARNAYMSNPYNQDARNLYAALVNGTNVDIQIK
ncbi:MAG: glycosyltransferase family 39 protein, partial [Candidatus Levyibacteriota bacterium]